MSKLKALQAEMNSIEYEMYLLKCKLGKVRRDAIRELCTGCDGLEERKLPEQHPDYKQRIITCAICLDSNHIKAHDSSIHL